ncbi:hypothetical protein RN629_05360 [Sphingomonadaceae bacterium jetA1]|jgi:hypothetical protein|uniref:hypothetical protein n=1 Tax=Facivitalis istanbulensis TaxID=3075838 RepID=UPI00348FCCDD
MSFQEMFGLYSETSRITDFGAICEIFTGSEGGSAIVSIRPTPGGCARHAVVTINPSAAKKVASIASERRRWGSYEDDPEGYEYDARMAFLDAVPEMTSGLMFAKTADATVIEVRGLPIDEDSPKTPSDGAVTEADVRSYIFNLVGSLAGSLSLRGFAYASENNGRLLRAVAPVRRLAAQASSQGFADDLGWHQDNANRFIPGLSEPKEQIRGPMNDYQAFVCVHAEDDVPMDVAALDDIVAEIGRRHGSVLVDILHRPEFGICRPASHGGGLDVEGVPLLARDRSGRLHGRFHASNVIGLTPEAQSAYERFKEILRASRSGLEIAGEKGALLLYANTRVMHRRRSFRPRFDEQDRYYIRLYLMNADALSGWNSLINDRVFL